MISLADYIVFIRTQMGIPIQYLPDDSLDIELSYCLAKEQVNHWFCKWKTIYPLMVYNLAGHILISIARDYSVLLASLTWSSGVVAATTITVNTFVTGNTILVSNVVPQSYNGVQSITVINSTHFTYPISINPGTCIIAGKAGFNLFETLRATYHMNNFVPGLIKSSADESTSESLTTPNWVNNVSLNDLDILKTPYGRFYAMYAQKFGSLSLSGV